MEPEPSRDDKHQHRRKRVPNACQRCRRHKIKCSGTNPCRTCDHRGLTCQFDVGDRKILVSENFVAHLKRRIAQLENKDGATKTDDQNVIVAGDDEELLDQGEGSDDVGGDVGDMVIDGDNEPELTAAESSNQPRPSSRRTKSNVHNDSGAVTDMSNPLASEKSAYVLDAFGRLRHLGHSSTWSFSRQVLNMAYQKTHSTPLPEQTLHVEGGEAYDLGLDRLRRSNVPEIYGLPSLDFSLYLIQTVKFRVCQLFHLFDEESFMVNFHKFYEDPAERVGEMKVWYAHYLILMAFGKTFNRQSKPSTTPAGFDLFVRAMSILPDITILCMEPINASEILCCVGLYLEAIDYRSAAYAYLGQALRIGISHGLHLHMRTGEMGKNMVQRCRRLWWTIYTLDRKSASLMGAPNSIHDEDISTPLPETQGAGSSTAALALHVKLCRVLGKIVNTVYGMDGRLNRTFLGSTQAVLRSLAGLADELSSFSGRAFGEISRVAAHLDLAYHQCIVVATRPFLFYLLKIRLGATEPPPNPLFPLSEPAKGLVQVCIDSARQIISILSNLREHDLLDTFIPYDLEGVFSASFVLAMASSLHPKLLPDQAWLTSVYDIMNEMIRCGNVLATFRKAEIDMLTQMLDTLSHQNAAQLQIHHAATPHNLQHQAVATPDTTAGAKQTVSEGLPQISSIDAEAGSTSIHGPESLPSLGNPFFEGWDPDEGLSPSQILNLADALDDGNLDDLWIQEVDLDGMYDGNPLL